MKKILITGATGFLGKYLVELFYNKGFEVLASGRNKRVGQKLIKDRVDFIACDLSDASACHTLVNNNIDYVVHAAALSSAWGTYADFYKSNVVATENLIHACECHKVGRLVFISSPSVYTATKDQFDLKEEDAPPTNNMNNYIKTKLMAEKKVKEANKRGLYTVVLRPRGLFGIGDPSIVPRILEVNESMGIPLFREGAQVIDITYVENVAHSVYLAVTSQNISGQVFNITNGQPLSFKKITDLLFDHLPLQKKYKVMNPKLFYTVASLMEFVYKGLNIKKEPVLTRYKACTLLYSQTLNIDKAKDLLGYTPKISVEEGIKIYTDWWKEND